MPYYQPAPQRARPTPKPKQKLPTSLKLFLVVALSVATYHFISPFNLLSGLGKSQKVAAAPVPVLNTAQASQMSAQINAVIAGNPNMQIGVSVQDLNNGAKYDYGVGQSFIAASISKILTATLFLHGVDSGRYSLSQKLGGNSARYQLQQMIVNSDNDAWLNFNLLLTHDGLKNYAKVIGLSNYDPSENSLTVNDISLLLGKIYKGHLLASSSTNLLLSYMQDASENNFIVASIPQNIKVYHKAGWLVDRIHDAAIIDNGKHPYVLVIFTKDDSGTYSSAQGQQIFSQLTTATTKAFL